MLGSSLVGYAYGVSGPFWFAAGCSPMIVFFSLLGISCKLKIPEAHTLLEIVRIRYGKITFHLMSGTMLINDSRHDCPLGVHVLMSGQQSVCGCKYASWCFRRHYSFDRDEHHCSNIFASRWSGGVYFCRRNQGNVGHVSLQTEPIS